jgi:dephospho-CoA kinase
MKVLGLTGGVGMGKSTAAGFFSQRGIRVVDTDEIARELSRPGQPALADIQAQFGHNIVATDGSLNRTALAHVVFNDPTALKRLEAILHPRIRKAWQTQVESWRQENCPLAVVVIPLLFETFAESQFDKIICVACALESQHERLRLRGWSDIQIRQRIAAQRPVDQKIARSHFVVWTEGSLEAHRQQITKIIGKI